MRTAVALLSYLQLYVRNYAIVLVLAYRFYFCRLLCFLVASVDWSIRLPECVCIDVENTRTIMYTLAGDYVLSILRIVRGKTKSEAVRVEKKTEPNKKVFAVKLRRLRRLCNVDNDD